MDIVTPTTAILCTDARGYTLKHTHTHARHLREHTQSHSYTRTRTCTQDATRWKAIKKLKRKAYVSLRTNLGNINLEVDCDITPQTAENFLGLAAKG
jgi:hypothetical protein